MKTLGIMQPYFLPYIGYYQLINTVDLFVLHDDVKFSKGGWINRNRILQNGASVFITLPLHKGSDYCTIAERRLADNWPSHRVKLLNRIKNEYGKATHFNQVFPVIEDCLQYPGSNLCKLINHSINTTCRHLGISTPIVLSSQLSLPDHLKGEKRVIEICKSKEAAIYYNPIGGLDLYRRENFASHGIELRFLKARPLSYLQFNHPHVPFLSIIDVMMFNSPTIIRDYLQNYEIL